MEVGFFMNDFFWKQERAFFLSAKKCVTTYLPNGFVLKMDYALNLLYFFEKKKERLIHFYYNYEHE